LKIGGRIDPLNGEAIRLGISARNEMRQRRQDRASRLLLRLSALRADICRDGRAQLLDDYGGKRIAPFPFARVRAESGSAALRYL